MEVSLASSMKRKVVFIILFCFLTSFLVFAKMNFKFNKQLGVSSFNKLYIYRFEVGKGWQEDKASYEQKKAVWDLLDNMISNMPPPKLKSEYTILGGYKSFYFKNKDFRTEVYLDDYGNDELFITVYNLGKDGIERDVKYFTLSTRTAEKIPNGHINRLAEYRLKK